MTLLPYLDRIAGAGFLAIAALLVARPPRASHARAVWGLLAAAGLAYGLALNLQPQNFPHANFLHYWLGAKYPVPYAETYRVWRAAAGEPQTDIRDLAQPARLERERPAERRAYLIERLRRYGAAFDPLAPLDTLAARARASGAIAAEADSIVAAHVPAARRAALRADVRTAFAAAQGPRLLVDFGYNGSPFYGLLRQADPLLHRPLGPLAAWEQLAWQLLGVALLAWLTGAALGYTTTERLVAAALVLVCLDFTNFALPGLVFTEVWVPVAFAAWAAARRRWALAGAATAVAGLLKLFPFVLALAVAVPLLRSLLPASAGEDRGGARRRALAFGAACVAVTLGLGLLGTASGRDWADFLHKITTEFHSRLNMANNVSLAALLIAAGVSDRSPLPGVAALVAAVVVAALFWEREDERFAAALPRRLLVLAFATGLLARSWLNYYVVLPFVLLPWAARRHRAGAAVALAAVAASHALPAYDDPGLLANPALHAAKLLPFVALPAWFLWLELRERAWSPRVRRAALTLAVLLAVATAGELWRQSALTAAWTSGEAALAAGDGAGALAAFDGVTRLDPASADGRRKRAIALATLGRLDEALGDFARAARMAPDDPVAHDDYARALLMRGQPAEAGAQLERALALAPADPQVLFVLARVRATQARPAEAIALLERARELAPEEPAIPEALAALRGGAAGGR